MSNIAMNEECALLHPLHRRSIAAAALSICVSVAPTSAPATAADLSVSSNQRPMASAVLAPGSPSVLSGITVQGRASVRRAADRARFNVLLASQGDPGRALVNAQAVVDALKKNNVPDAVAAISVLQSYRGAVSFVVTGTITHPSNEVVQRLAFALASDLPKDIVVNNLSYFVSLDDCELLTSTLLRSAMADARRIASEAAANANLRVGEPLSLSVNVSSFGCPGSTGNAPVYINAISGPDAGRQFDIESSASVTVTFAIR